MAESRPPTDTPETTPVLETAPDSSAWAPLRHADFRRLWLAQFTSNVGSWMQTVAAQWVMTSLTSLGAAAERDLGRRAASRSCCWRSRRARSATWSTAGV